MLSCALPVHEVTSHPAINTTRQTHVCYRVPSPSIRSLDSTVYLFVLLSQYIFLVCGHSQHTGQHGQRIDQHRSTRSTHRPTSVNTMVNTANTMANTANTVFNTVNTAAITTINITANTVNTTANTSSDRSLVYQFYLFLCVHGPTIISMMSSPHKNTCTQSRLK